MTHSVLFSPSSVTRVYPSYDLIIRNGSTNTAQRRQPLYLSDHSLQTDGELISVNSGGEALSKDSGRRLTFWSTGNSASRVGRPGFCSRKLPENQQRGFWFH